MTKKITLTDREAILLTDMCNKRKRLYYIKRKGFDISTVSYREFTRAAEFYAHLANKFGAKKDK